MFEVKRTKVQEIVSIYPDDMQNKANGLLRTWLALWGVLFDGFDSLDGCDQVQLLCSFPFDLVERIATKYDKAEDSE